MLAQKNRLQKKKDFDNVFEKGKGFKQGFLYLKVKKNNLEFSRFGFVVGKNFSNKAVERNKIKRRLREIVKNKLSEIKKSLDVVIIVNPETENDFQKLEQTINQLFKEAGIL